MTGEHRTINISSTIAVHTYILLYITGNGQRRKRKPKLLTICLAIKYNDNYEYYTVAVRH